MQGRSRQRAVRGALGSTRPLAAPATQSYSLEEIENQLGLPIRVIRSWMAPPLRILVGPGRGSGRRYSQSFLDRAKLVQRMRTERYTLEEIAQRLSTIPDDEIPGLLAKFESSGGSRPRESAADYAARALRTRGIHVNRMEAEIGRAHV